jgi:hypothetical protein
VNKHNSVSAEGRLPPPEEYRIPKGKSGNYKGRPRGSVSLTKLTRKVANIKYRAVIDGVSQRRTLLELVILKIQALALMGNPGAAALIKDVWGLTVGPEPVKDGGFLLIPESLTVEELMAEEEARNANTVEPGTEVNVEVEEFLKAARGEPSPLGEALIAFRRKYGALGTP